MKTNILDIQFDNLTREEARQAGAELLRSSDFHYAVTPNPEFILTAWDNELAAAQDSGNDDAVLDFHIDELLTCYQGILINEKFHGFDAPIHKAIEGLYIGLHAVAGSPDILYDLLGRNLLWIDDAVQMEIIQKFSKIDMVQLCDDLFLHAVHDVKGKDGVNFVDAGTGHKTVHIFQMFLVKQLTVRPLSLIHI